MANIGREFIPSPTSEAFRLQTYVYTAAGAETSVTQSDAGMNIKYNIGYVAVYVNGTRLIPGTDYTATTGTSIDGLTALYAGDLVEVIGMPLTPVEDTVSKGAGGTFDEAVAFDNGVTINTTGSQLNLQSDGVARGAIYFLQNDTATAKLVHYGDGGLNFRNDTDNLNLDINGNTAWHAGNHFTSTEKFNVVTSTGTSSIVIPINSIYTARLFLIHFRVFGTVSSASVARSVTGIHIRGGGSNSQCSWGQIAANGYGTNYYTSTDANTDGITINMSTTSDNGWGVRGIVLVGIND